MRALTPLSLPGLSGPVNTTQAPMSRLSPTISPMSINQNLMAPAPAAPMMPTAQNWNGFLGGSGLGLLPWQQHNYQPHPTQNFLQPYTPYAPDADPNNPYRPPYQVQQQIDTTAPDADPNNPLRRHQLSFFNPFKIT